MRRPFGTLFGAKRSGIIEPLLGKSDREDGDSDTEAGAKNNDAPDSSAQKLSTYSKFTLPLKKVVASALTKTQQPEALTTVKTQNQELAFDLACSTGDIENFNNIIDQQFDIINKQCNGEYPLITALKNKRSEIAIALIEKGANPDPRNNGAPLRLACQAGDENTVKALIDKKVDLNKIKKHTEMNAVDKDFAFGTPLMLASLGGHEQVVKLLIANNVNINAVDANGVTALVNASRSCHLAIVDRLIGAGADVNSKNPNAFTALHAASMFDTEAKIVKKLIEAHAKLDPIWYEESPLHLASKKCMVKTVEILVSAGANVDLVTSDNKNRTPLHLVCDKNVYLANSNDIIEVAKILIANTANIDAVDSEGETALFKACKKGHADIARELIDAGAKINQATKAEIAPIDTACINYNTEIVQILFNAGANVNPKIIKECENEVRQYLALAVSEITNQEITNQNLTNQDIVDFINLIKELATKEKIDERNEKLNQTQQKPSAGISSAGARKGLDNRGPQASEGSPINTL